MDRAQKRAEEKASRAAAAGIKLPSKKSKKNGWRVLREKLREGTLMPALKQIDTTKGRLSSTRRRSSMYALKAHLADVAYQMHSRQSMAISKTDTKLLAEHQKASQELNKRKRNERQFRRQLIKKQKRLERELEYLNFPTILGWYFDGFFTPYFQLNEEYATIFNQMEQDISKTKEHATKETFAEKAKKYFWPPHIIANFCFRTRGIYLDSEEVIKDPPHTPPEIILDQRVEAVTLFLGNENLDAESKVPSDEEVYTNLLGPATTSTPSLADLAAEEDRVQALIKAIDDNPDLTAEDKAAKKRALLSALQRHRQKTLLQQQVADEMKFKGISKNDFYFDDQIPGFFRKKARDRDKYYYDSTWDVWRIKRKIIQFPNDFYWDEQLAIFFPKDRTRPQDHYLYDPNLGCYRVAGEPVPPNWRGIMPIHFFFDHKVGKWVRKTKAPAGMTPYFDKNCQRFCANKTVDTPDDFYFDVVNQQFSKKVPDEKYTYNSKLGAWMKTDSEMPPKRSLKPMDFYWNEKENAFIKKDAPSSFFAWDGNNNFFRKKKSLHGKFHPKNWTWVDKKKTWELKKFTSRHNLISESLYWRPDRDYDKPWQEYVGGYRDYHIEYDYEKLSDEDEGVKLVGSGGRVMGKSEGTSSGKSGKKLKFSMSEPNTKTGGGSSAPGSQTKVKGSERDDAESISSSKPVSIMKDKDQSAELAYVDTLDRKTLKVTNLSPTVNDTDLRKYFASVKKIVRPKVPGSEYDEDYAYLKFKSDEAAAAALRTMHQQNIRGQPIKLSYKLKKEDENVGGQRDTFSQQPLF